jgi:hypothetical protein
MGRGGWKTALTYIIPFVTLGALVNESSSQNINEYAFYAFVYVGIAFLINLTLGLYEIRKLYTSYPDNFFQRLYDFSNTRHGIAKYTAFDEYIRTGVMRSGKSYQNKR